MAKIERTEKICAKCGVNQPIENFSIDRHTPDGHNYWCRKCCSLQQKERDRKKYRERGIDKRRYGNNAVFYRVVYDPCNSFGYQSEFTRREINDMLAMEFIAIGTRFQWKDRYYEINENMRMVKA